MSTSSKSPMHSFIEALYGVVIGVSFFKIEDLNSKLDWELAFNFAFFVFTLIIAAHDWYTYHERYDVPAGFDHHLPQIFSLLFLAIMFGACTYEKICFWYLAAIGYCVSNMAGIENIKGDNTCLEVWLISFHYVFAVAMFLFLLPNNSFILHQLGKSQLVALGLTIFVVIGTWNFKHCFAKGKCKAQSSVDCPPDAL